MLGFLIYIPTLFFIPHYFFLVPLFYLFLFKKDADFKINNNEIFLFFIVFLMLINYLIFAENTDDIIEILPYPVLMIVSLLIAKNLKERDLNILLFLIIFEVFIGIVQFKLGVYDIFGSSLNLDYGEGLLYFNRVRGLSDNVAPFALKILIGCYLVFILNYHRNIKILLYLILFFGLAVSFSRAAILAFLILFCLSFLRSFRVKSWKTIVVILLGTLVFTVMYNLYFDILFEQLTRGTGEIEGSGREVIWKDFIAFIENNFFFGNGSHKLMVESSYYGIAHAHNSFLQFFATNGFLISIIMLLWVILNVNKHNFEVISSILIFSVFNYGIFWGISIFDILFYYFLLYSKKV